MPTVWSDGRAFTLPDNPNVGDTVVIGNRVWTWNGTQWVVTPVGNQTPWLSNIDGANFNLGNVGAIGVAGPAVAGGNPRIQITGTNQTSLECVSTTNNGISSIDFRNTVSGTRAFVTFYGNPAAGFVLNTLGTPAPSIHLRTANSQALSIDGATQRVGIGTAAPAYLLDVTGDCNLSAGSVYRINGVPLPGQTPWVSDIDGANFNLGNVGAIGVAGPAVAGGDPRIQITGTNQTSIECVSTMNNGYSSITFRNTDTSTRGFVTFYGNPTQGLNLNTIGTPVPSILLRTANAIALSIDGGTRRVGIGTAAPAYPLDVNGDCNLSAGSVYRIDGVPLLGQTPWTSNIDGANFNLGNVGAVGIGTSSPLANLDVVSGSKPASGIATADGAFRISSNPWISAPTLLMGVDASGAGAWIQAMQPGFAGNSLLLNLSGGNVGIGTANPQARLHCEDTTILGGNYVEPDGLMTWSVQIDQGGNQLIFRAKYNDGGVRTGAIPLA